MTAFLKNVPGLDTAAKSTEQQSLQLAPRLRPTCAGITFEGRVAFAMKLISLTRGKVAIVDDEDFDGISSWPWYARKSKRKRNADAWYAVRHSKNDESVYMHRQIVFGDAPFNGAEVDHIDGNGLNNQKHNLRQATRGQNCRNQTKQGGTTSKFKGVTWDKARNKWKAQIEYDGRHYNLGRFDSEQEAAIAYNSVAIPKFGEFANANP